MNTAELMSKLKEEPDFITQLGREGKQLSDFNPENLKVEVMHSGFPSLDSYKLLKKNRGELIILGARPSQGKSGLGFQIATSVAKTSKSLIFSLEMDHESIVARQASIILNRPLDYIQRGWASPDELERVKAGLERYNCVIDDAAGLNVYQICDRARTEHRYEPLSLVVVDFIQIVDYDRKGNRAIELAGISMALKNLAKELRIPVIALSQLNRMSESRDDGMPIIADLKESGSLEQDADVVLLIHRSKDTPNVAKIIIGKNRNGPTGEVELEFAPSFCMFIDHSTNVLD